jgi:hypothetical protein
LRIKGEAQKSGNDQLLPLTPDFSEFLLQTPEARRHGRVFRLNTGTTGRPIAAHVVGMMVTAIGARAGVIVNAVDRKTASAHDLRRAFATRWARRVAPAVIQTTMGYYVDLDTEEMADELWANHPPAGNNAIPGNTFGNNGPDSAGNEESPTAVTDCRDSTYDKAADGARIPDDQIDNRHRHRDDDGNVGGVRHNPPDGRDKTGNFSTCGRVLNPVKAL